MHLFCFCKPPKQKEDAKVCFETKMSSYYLSTSDSTTCFKQADNELRYEVNPSNTRSHDPAGAERPSRRSLSNRPTPEPFSRPSLHNANRRLLRMLEGSSYLVTAVTQDGQTVLYQNDASTRYHGVRAPSAADTVVLQSEGGSQGSLLSVLFSVEGAVLEQVRRCMGVTHMDLQVGSSLQTFSFI